MKVIVIGNGPSLLENKHGKLIDSFDIVVRFNAYSIEGFQEHVGTKTDYWFNTINYLNKTGEKRMKHAYKRFVWHSWNWNLQTDNAFKEFKDFLPGVEKFKTERKTIEEIQAYVGDKQYFTYSTGAIAIWMLLKEHDILTITGFDWWKKNNKHHYNDSVKIGSNHKPEKELILIQKLMKEGKIKFLETKEETFQGDKTPWYKHEDDKYSDLYSKGYPIGNPMGLVKNYGITSTTKVIDLGCGRATLSRQFRNYTGVDVSQYIIEENKKAKPNATFYHMSLDEVHTIKDKFEAAICADVMEHIPEDKIDAVFSSISKLDCEKFYFAISTRKSVYLDSEGGNLHLSVLPFDQWIEHISKYFHVIQAEHKGSLLNVKCKAL